ncbi:MAG: hypothetical protein ABFC67_08225 [Mizugakiibacter sp.]|uniref:hypothetical protein n=1 Tax=Mizugakiibacter sp. TaxID=1972610 RepID=UPI0031C9A178|nr:hypothetical protein [Xanthomonadaceae bacterium]
MCRNRGSTRGRWPSSLRQACGACRVPDVATLRGLAWLAAALCTVGLFLLAARARKRKRPDGDRPAARGAATREGCVRRF